LFYLAEEAEPRIKGSDQVAWLDLLEAENDNLRAAIGRSLEAGDALTAARLGWALAEGIDLPPHMRARALYALGLCVSGSGDDERLMAISEESAALFRREGDTRRGVRTAGVELRRSATGSLRSGDRGSREGLGRLPEARRRVGISPQPEPPDGRVPQAR